MAKLTDSMEDRLERHIRE